MSIKLGPLKSYYKLYSIGGSLECHRIVKQYYIHKKKIEHKNIKLVFEIFNSYLIILKHLRKIFELRIQKISR